MSGPSGSGAAANFPNVAYVVTNNIVTSTGGPFSSTTLYMSSNRVGQWVDINWSLAITNNGSAAGTIQIPLPFPATKYSQGQARQVAAPGKMCTATITGGTTMDLVTYDNLYAGGSGQSISGTARYEIAAGS